MQTIQQAKDFLAENFDEGEDCPCCGQMVKRYKYNLFATSAMALIDLYKLEKETGVFFHHISKFAEARKGRARASHFAELRFWGLAHPMDKKTATENSSGMWRMTDLGRAFVERRTGVPKSVMVFNNKFQGLTGEIINIKQALGNKFDYEEVMK